ncbi:hypothetical protein SASPL_147673 [Salvia splendens]|uniref:Uncharacterized protein n=1 Tax=Salvia splendens TaxID=180675 RepID=A0A8X8Z613_SALSN|nr:hypothetical protein SASPL_147673 [Salvia splendens]
MEEIAAGLLRSGRPFLWVIRAMADLLCSGGADAPVTRMLCHALWVELDSGEPVLWGPCRCVSPLDGSGDECEDDRGLMDGEVKSLEFRQNANKWKGLAREAAAENGSSTMNLKAFLVHAS